MNPNDTNIFFHAPKELTTDAFLVWLFYFLDSDKIYESAKQDLFDMIVLKEADKGRSVRNICLKRQENHVDVILSFVFNDENKPQVVLFENKTWSSYHSNQLIEYKSKYPNSYRYLYYKLAYINSQEKQYVTDCGYDVITAKMISSAIERHISLHPLIKMYNEYITQSFINPNETFHDKLFVEKDYSVLWGAEAQKYLCDLIVKEMDKQGFSYVGIRNGTIYGRPWTQIDIAEKKEGYWEKLFWRVDIRSNKFYIRLNQYSDPANDFEIDQKMKRKDYLRERINDFPEVSNFKIGLVTNGVKESEIIIFFLEENDLSDLISAVPAISKKIVDVFNNLEGSLW